MNEPKADNIVKRLDRLERENRRVKQIGALLLLGIGTMAVMGQALPISREEGSRKMRKGDHYER